MNRNYSILWELRARFADRLSPGVLTSNVFECISKAGHCTIHDVVPTVDMRGAIIIISALWIRTLRLRDHTKSELESPALKAGGLGYFGFFQDGRMGFIRFEDLREQLMLFERIKGVR